MQTQVELKRTESNLNEAKKVWLNAVEIFNDKMRDKVL